MGTIFLGATKINLAVESFVISGRTEGSSTREFRSPGARSAPGGRPHQIGDSKRRFQEAAQRACRRRPRGGSELPEVHPKGGSKRRLQEAAQRGQKQIPIS